MSEIQKRLNKILDMLATKETPTLITFIKESGTDFYKVNHPNQYIKQYIKDAEQLKFNNEQEIKAYLKEQRELTGVRILYMIINEIDNSHLESALYDID